VISSTCHFTKQHFSIRERWQARWKDGR